MNDQVVIQQHAGTLATNKVLKNTYLLLAFSLAFSALAAGVGMAVNMPFLPWWMTLIGYFGLLFLTSANRNNGFGIVCVFLLTGFMGLTLGPVIDMFLATSAGSQIVLNALGGTAVIFFGLSAYALTTKKDFSFMRGFLFAGIMVAFLAGLGAILFSIPALSLAVSAAFLLLSSGIILYQTSEIIHGGETNYIMATVTLYVSLYNIFISLLNLLSAFGDD